MQQVEPFVFNKMEENSFVVWDEAGKTAVLVDPGCASQQELDVLETFLDRNALLPAAILVTHPHFDHAEKADAIAKLFGIPVAYHEADDEIFDIIVSNPPYLKKFL